MATSSTQLAFAIRAVNEASATLKAVQGDIQGISDKATKSHGPLGGLGSSLGGVAKIAGGFVLGAGLFKLPGLLAGAAQAAADDEASQLKLQKAVENTGAAFGTFSGQLDKSISTAQRRGFTDDEARNSLSLLAAQTGDTDEAMRRFGLAQDLARGAGIPLEQASRLLGKVTAENVEVFKRMGITIGEGASEAEAFAVIQGKFGGQSEEFANSTAGHFAAVKIQMGELKEKIGTVLLPVMAKIGKVLVDDVIPALSDLADKVQTKLTPIIRDDLKPALNDVKDFLRDDIVPALQDGASAIGDVMKNDVLPAFVEAWENLEGPLKTAAGKLGDLFRSIADNKNNLRITAATFGIFVALVTAFKVGAFVQSIASMIAALFTYTVVAGGGSVATGALTLALGALKVALITTGIGALFIGLGLAAFLIIQHWDDIVKFWNDTFKPMLEGVAAKFREIIDSVIAKIRELPVIGEVAEAVFSFIGARVQFWMDAVKAVIDVVMGLITGDWDRVWQGLKALALAPLELLKSDVGTALNLVKGAAGDALAGLAGIVKKPFDDALAAIKGLGTDAVNAARGFIISLTGGLKDAVNNILIGTLEGVINRVIRGANKLIGTVNSLDVFGIVPDLPKIPEVSIPRLARGGLLTEPTLFIGGDAGARNPEIVSPVALMRQVVREESGAGMDQRGFVAALREALEGMSWRMDMDGVVRLVNDAQGRQADLYARAG